jgi:hypothetical protein
MFQIGHSWSSNMYGVLKSINHACAMMNTSNIQMKKIKWIRSTFLVESALTRWAISHLFFLLMFYLKDLINEQFTTHISTQIIKLSTIKLIGVKGVYNHIMHMWGISYQLKDLDTIKSNTFLVNIFCAFCIFHHRSTFPLKAKCNNI